VWSAAERSSRATDRVREFTASEIVAFALAFELPIAWFFLSRAPTSLTPERLRWSIHLATLAAARRCSRGDSSISSRIVDDPDLRREFARRLEHLDPNQRLSGNRRRTDTATLYAASEFERLLGDPTVVASNLRELADHIANLPFEQVGPRRASTRGGNRGAVAVRALDDPLSTRCTTCGDRRRTHPREADAEDACRQDRRAKKATPTTKKATRRPK